MTDDGTLVSAAAFDAKPPATAVGTEQQLGDRYIAEAAPTFAEWNRDIASRIQRAGSPEAASSALASWAQSAAKSEDVTDAIYQAAMMAAMGGALHVRVVEVPEAASSRALSRVALAADGSISSDNVSFLALPFEEAIADFQARGIVTPEQFRAMDATARQRAFTAAGFATDALRQHAYDALLSALENGSTLAEFAADIRSGEQPIASDAYLETVFRTNVASAYAAGRFQQMGEPVVLAARPFVQVRAIIDTRTTSICRYLNGLTFDRRTDPGYSRFLGPNHYQCRTGSALLARAEPSLLIRSEDVDRRGWPQPPFDQKPSLSLEQ